MRLFRCVVLFVNNDVVWDFQDYAHTAPFELCSDGFRQLKVSVPVLVDAHFCFDFDVLGTVEAGGFGDMACKLPECVEVPRANGVDEAWVHFLVGMDHHAVEAYEVA